MKKTRHYRLASIGVGLAFTVVLLTLLWSHSQSSLLAAQPEAATYWHSSTHTPESEPVRSQIVDPQSPAANVLISDGSFEDVPSAWSQSINQTACGSLSKIGDWSQVFTNTVAAYDGLQSLWVGGVCTGPIFEPLVNSAEQQVDVPVDATALSFWYNAYRGDPDSPTFDDVAYVEINQQRVWELDLTQAANTAGWQQVQIDLAPYVGQQVTLKLGNDAGTADTLVGNALFDFIQFVTSDPVSTIIDPATGGVLVFTDGQGSDTTIEVPPAAVSETVQLVYVPQAEPGFPLPPGFVSANHSFDLDAFATRIFLPVILDSASSGVATQVLESVQNDGVRSSSSFTFTRPITITIEYSDQDIGAISDEGTLALYFYNETTGRWEDALSTCPDPSGYTSDPANNYVQLKVCHLSRMGLIGR